MYIFFGKLNWSYYVKAEPIVLLFPADLAYNDPVCAYWQWTVDGGGRRKVKNMQQSFITSFSKELDGRLALGFVFGKVYTFTAVVAENANTLKLTMRDQDGTASEGDFLRQTFWQPSKIASCAVYGDKFNTPKFISRIFSDTFYAHDELIIVVVPNEFVAGQPVSVYFQWTEDHEGLKNSNAYISANFDTATPTSDGGVAISFKSNDRSYVWNGTVTKDRSKLTLNVNIAANYVSRGWSRDSGPQYLHKSGWSFPTARKALLVRYGVGTDLGIFDVQKLLTNSLGFDSESIEMLYYNSEPQGRPATREDGQQAPTVTRFKERFRALIHDASAGDVRFLYVDAHGSPRDDPHSRERDKIDEGWKLAKGEDGLHVEVVYDDWLAETINRDLASGVNLTILTSSCLGGGMLDTHKGTRGILLAGCHESQSNVKVSGQDPWTLAVIEVVEGHKRRNRSMPTYAQLYTRAKAYIIDQMRKGRLRSTLYLGPSPDERNPQPRRPDNSSHQDPQLVFSEGYVNVDVDRFLSPLSGWEPLIARMNPEPTTQLPKDDL